MDKAVTVVGAGLAGVEAAWQCVRRGVPVRLIEMRPSKTTPAHRTPFFAELVCSNSLKSQREGTAPALLKREMADLSSLTLAVAAETAVPAGGALAVDRSLFAERVTARLTAAAGVTLVREEATSLPPPPAVVATGPLTSDAFAAALAAAVGRDNLYFYDALAPIVAAASVDASLTYRANRYNKEGGYYVNCPLGREEYDAFVAGLVAAATAPLRDFEKALFFEGCLPVEELARRGRDTLRFGPLKPVGLADPRTGRVPYAVLQLRQEDTAGTALGLVGCQTRLTPSEQRRVFGLVPALRKAEYLRYGAAHRNTYICAPLALHPSLMLKQYPGLFLAGQIAGVEGYVESAAMGIIAGINAARWGQGLPAVYPPRETAMGALINYLCSSTPSAFSPMNFNFGLLPPAGVGNDRGTRHVALWSRAREAFRDWVGKTGITVGQPPSP